VINVGRKEAVFFSVIIFGVFLVGLGVAFGGDQPSVMGHSIGELDTPMVCDSGKSLIWDGDSWGCGSSFSYSNYYSIASRNQGTRTENMGSHLFCTLSYVRPGGFNSHCKVYISGENWILEVRDPNDSYGDTHTCGANCFD